MATVTKEDMDRVIDAMQDKNSTVDYFQNQIQDMPNKEDTEERLLGLESSNQDFAEAFQNAQDEFNHIKPVEDINRNNAIALQKDVEHMTKSIAKNSGAVVDLLTTVKDASTNVDDIKTDIDSITDTKTAEKANLIENKMISGIGIVGNDLGLQAAFRPAERRDGGEDQHAQRRGGRKGSGTRSPPCRRRSRTSSTRSSGSRRR